MKKKFAIITIAALLVWVGPLYADTEALGITPSMIKADYWILHADDADETIMQTEDIELFNKKIYSNPATHCTNISSFSKTISAESLKNAISPNKRLRPKNFVEGKKVTQDFLDSLIEECNIGAIPETVDYSFAFVKENSSVRSLPTDKGSYTTEKGKLFDRYTVSSVKIWEPVIVLHRSLSGQWAFVRTKNCEGWLKTESLAFCDRPTLKKYLEMPFIIVTTAKIYPREGLVGRRWEFLLGTRLPMEEEQNLIVNEVGSYTSRVALLPDNDENGNFATRQLLIPLNADVHEGYLKYTQSNLLRVAFKLLGEPYGWGGDFSQWDCSAMIHDIYAVFGFDLPRNSLVQTRVPSCHIDVKNIGDSEKEKILSELPAGSYVQMPGHIMLYVGTAKGKPYILHECYSLYKGTEQQDEIIINCAAVTSMEMYRGNGKKIISCIENINAIK